MLLLMIINEHSGILFSGVMASILDLEVFLDLRKYAKLSFKLFQFNHTNIKVVKIMREIVTIICMFTAV